MHPGEGAIAYAREITYGMSRSDAAKIISTLRTTPPIEKNVKLCVNCGFPFRDKTKPGNTKVCGYSCKTDRKSAQKAQQRSKKAAPVKPKKEKRYSERDYMMGIWRHETPKSPEKLESISAARQRYEAMGGRRKPKHRVEY